MNENYKKKKILCLIMTGMDIGILNALNVPSLNFKYDNQWIQEIISEQIVAFFVAVIVTR